MGRLHPFIPRHQRFDRTEWAKPRPTSTELNNWNIPPLAHTPVHHSAAVKKTTSTATDKEKCNSMILFRIYSNCFNFLFFLCACHGIWHRYAKFSICPIDQYLALVQLPWLQKLNHVSYDDHYCHWHLFHKFLLSCLLCFWNSVGSI